MPSTYSTKNIELAAAIQATIGLKPSISFDGSGLATLTFSVTSDVTSTVMQYEADLQIDARTILTIRNQLFKRIKGGHHVN